MGLFSYPVVRAREHDGVVYKIEFIPHQNTHIIKFSNPAIPSQYCGEEADTFAEMEKEAIQAIDEYNKNKK